LVKVFEDFDSSYDGCVRSTTPYPLFRRVLRALRLKRGWTQEQLAERAKADYKYLQLVELGRTGMPSLDLVERVAKALGTKVWVLLCDDKDMIAGATGLEGKDLAKTIRRPGRPAQTKGEE
jgi:transcriptional regulator with XRE-family HTH domain